jgi:GNAT superfamily N-acetyltransferase
MLESTSLRRPAADLSFETVEYAQCANRVASFRNLNRETERSDDYFRWRYMGRPSTQGGYVTWALDEQGGAIAAASFITHEFSVLGLRQYVGVVGDISVQPLHRGKGIARELLSEVRRAASSRGLNACFVLPNPEVTSALSKAGFAPVASIVRDVRLLSLKRRFKKRFGAAGRLAAIFVDPLLGFQRARRGAAAAQGYEVREAAAFDRDADGLWDSIEKEARVLSVRNYAYLHWRFDAKPGATYRRFEIRRGGELYGYLVHHFEDDMTIVDDFLVRDATAARVLGQEFIQTVRDNAWADAIQARFLATTNMSIPWRGAGFVRRADSQLVMWADAVPPPVPPDAWFVTPADKDV